MVLFKVLFKFVLLVVLSLLISKCIIILLVFEVKNIIKVLVVESGLFKEIVKVKVLKIVIL